MTVREPSTYSILGKGKLEVVKFLKARFPLSVEVKT